MLLLGRSFPGRRHWLGRASSGIAGCALALVLSLGGAPAAANEFTESKRISPRVAGWLANAPADIVLSAADIDRYDRIFVLQNFAEWEGADREIADLEDRRLLGYVLFQRYMHPTGWRSTYEELSAWLAEYADLPGAERIHALALQRRPDGSSEPPEPTVRAPIYGYVERYGVEPCSYDAPSEAAVAAGERIDALLDDDRIGSALVHLHRPELNGQLDAVERDRLRAEIAADLFYEGEIDRAVQHARPSANRSGGLAPRAQWIAGLGLWHQGDYEGAARYFEGFAESPCASAWGRAGGAFWAARAHLRAGAVEAVSPWLARAAEYPRTFYGLVARRALGLDMSFDFAPPSPTAAHLAALAEHPAGARAIGLLQIGRRRLAEAELIRIWPEPEERLLIDALVAFAQGARLPRLAYSYGSALQPHADGYYDGALYPVAPWKPLSGFQVDRALVYAIVREESRFNPGAVSYAGATGLMQLMPATATHVGATVFDDLEADDLVEPEVNLELGQTHLGLLFADPMIGNNLLRLIAAYHAGQGNLARWSERIDAPDDPLYFLESLPSSATRAYVERVLSSYWIYRQQLGQPNTSLDALAAGKWPRYVPLDNLQVADYGRS